MQASSHRSQPQADEHSAACLEEFANCSRATHVNATSDRQQMYHVCRTALDDCTAREMAAGRDEALTTDEAADEDAEDYDAAEDAEDYDGHARCSSYFDSHLMATLMSKEAKVMKQYNMGKCCSV